MIGRRAFLGLACFVAAAILSGCQTLPREARRWQGRFSLVAHSAAQNVSETGRFELVEAPDFRRLDLLTPLSGVIARIESTSQGASLWFGSSSEPATAPNIDALLLRRLGFTVPVELLIDLLSGENGSADTGSAGGWQYEISSRTSSGTPRRLVFKHESAGQIPEIKLILAVNDA